MLGCQQMSLLAPWTLIGQRVLLADDNTHHAVELTQSLVKAGASVLHAHRLDEALSLSGEQPVTVGAINLHLNGQSTSALRARLDVQGVPLVVLRGCGDAIEDLSSGVPNLLMPVKASELVRALRDTLVHAGFTDDTLPNDLLRAHRCLMMAELRITRQEKIVERLSAVGCDPEPAQQLLRTMLETRRQLHERQHLLARLSKL